MFQFDRQSEMGIMSVAGEGEYKSRGGYVRGGPNEGSNVRAFGRGCGNEVDGGERRGGGRK
jgi:hypothetical protein